MIEMSGPEEIREFIRSGRMRLLYLSRPDCGVCSAVKSKVIRLMDEYDHLEGAYIDLDKIPEAAGEYSIFTIPGILLYADGRELIREARYISIEDLESRINRFYNMIYN